MTRPKSVIQLLINTKQAIANIQKVLDAYCLAGVNINPESRVKVKEGPVNKELMQQEERDAAREAYNVASRTYQKILEESDVD